VTDIVQAPKAPSKFQKGQSGNPAGRPKGSKNVISLIKIQLEGELRAQMRPHMQAVVAEMVRQALPRDLPRLDAKGAPVLNQVTGEPIVDTIPGDRDMLKTLFSSWVSKTRPGEDESPKEKIQIVIGKLDQIPPVNGQTFQQSE
jgi:hypothetical protein